MHDDEILFTEFFNQKLKERGYSLKRLSEETGIAMKHLESFSHGRFERLPPAPYLHGYFVRLGAILDFDPNEWWHRIREEEAVHRSGPQDRMPGNRFTRSRRRIIVTLAVLVALGLIYIGARYTTIIGEPQIVLTSPDASVNNISISPLTFQGTVKNGDVLLINSQNVPLAPDGSFSTDVSLQPGPNTIEIVAEKTLGQSITLTREINYNYQSTPTIIPATSTTPTTSSTPSHATST